MINNLCYRTDEDREANIAFVSEVTCFLRQHSFCEGEPPTWSALLYYFLC